MLQCTRYRSSRWANISAELDAALRLTAEARGDNPAGSRPLLVPTVALRRQERAELAFMLAALGNAVRAERRLPPRYRTAAAGVRGALQALRDLSLSWDEPAGVPRPDGSETARNLRVVFETAGADGGDHADAISMAEAARFAEMLAEDPPSALGLSLADPEEVSLAGVPLSLVEAWLVEARAAFAEALSDAGEEVPDPLDSRLPGDDGTAWPPDDERVRTARWEDFRLRDREARGALKRLAALVDAMLGDAPQDG